MARASVSVISLHVLAFLVGGHGGKYNVWVGTMSRWNGECCDTVAIMDRSLLVGHRLICKLRSVFL
jgi:hypothetical protein